MLRPTKHGMCFPLLFALCCISVDGRIGILDQASKLTILDSDDAIVSQFIVRFSDSVSEDEVETKAAEVAQQTGAKILWTYKHAFKGVALQNAQQRRFDSILGSATIRAVEQVRFGCAGIELHNTIFICF